MLGAMAAVAVLAALLGPIVRKIDPDMQVRLLATWAVWLAASITWVGYLTYQRRKAERLVGRARLKLPLYDENLPDASALRRWFGIVLSVLFSLYLVSTLSLVTTSSRAPMPPVTTFSHAIIALMCFWWTARTITAVWWRANVRFGERGILWDRRALIWDHIVSWVWDARRTDIIDVRGIDQFNRDMALRVHVPEKLRGEVESLLRSQVKPKPNVEILMPGNMLARAPLSTAIRETRFFKGCAFGLLFFALFILGEYLFPAGFTGVREFDHMILFGVALCGFTKSFWRMRQTPSAGAPIARLWIGPRWLSALACVLAAAALYCVGCTLGATSEYVGYTAGLGFGAFAAAAIGCVWRTPLDVRTNGIYFRGTLWPWREVKVASWNPENGKLALSYGWRRLVARVPVEQRPAVNEIMQQKVTRVAEPPEMPEVGGPEIGHIDDTCKPNL
jgi:hypothetical protein